MEGGVDRAVDVPSWANEHEPTTGESRSRRSRSISSWLRLEADAEGVVRSPYVMGTCPSGGTKLCIGVVRSP